MSAGKILLILFLAIILGCLIFGMVTFIKLKILPDLSQRAENIKGEIGENIRCQIKCSVANVLGINCNC